MYGAILGDMIGSPYEFDLSGKTKDFPLFIPGSRFTDDTVMTCAEAPSSGAAFTAIGNTDITAKIHKTNIVFIKSCFFFIDKKHLRTGKRR